MVEHVAASVPVFIFASLMFWLWKQSEVKRRHLEERVTGLENILSNRVLPDYVQARAELRLLDHRVDDVAAGQREHEARHVPVDRAAARRTAIDAMARQQEIEEALGG